MQLANNKEISQKKLSSDQSTESSNEERGDLIVLFLTFVFLISALLSPPVSADKRDRSAYVGVGYSPLVYEADGGSSFADQDADLVAYDIRFGAHTNDYFGLEFRLGRSNESEQIDFSVGQSTVELDYFLTAFAKPSIPIGENLRVHGLLGYSLIESTVEISSLLGTASESEDINGVSYGLGVELIARPSVAMTIDYISLLEEDGDTVDGISFGFQIRSL